MADLMQRARELLADEYAGTRYGEHLRSTDPIVDPHTARSVAAIVRALQSSDEPSSGEAVNAGRYRKIRAHIGTIMDEGLSGVAFDAGVLRIHGPEQSLSELLDAVADAIKEPDQHG